MNGFIIVFVVICPVVFLVIAIVILGIKRSINKFSRNYLGKSAGEAAKMLMDGLSEECRLPYSVPKLTPLYKPKIERDFPEMSFQQMESMAKNGVIDILNAIESGEPQKVANSSVRLRDQLFGIIEDYRSKGETAHYDSVKIHSVGVESYTSSADSAAAVFQTALESFAYVTREGQIVLGTNKQPTQNLFSVTLTHNQDIGEDDGRVYIGTNCPNCGAPVPAVGERECPYCGSGLVAAVDKIWQIDSFRLLK